MSVRILVGDCREALVALPDASVQCVVTSPPYWGLRDYGVAGQLGLEATPGEYVAAMVAVFREVWRVLRPDGVVWLNLGDSYAANGTPGQSNLAALGEAFRGGGHKRDDVMKPRKIVPSGLKPGDLVGIPWRVAFALQDDGWWLRQDNVWAKPNPMPESVRNRTTRAHEYMFHLTKSGDTQFWTHRNLPGVRSQPAPDYRWVHRVTKEERDIDPGDKAWRRVNLWSGHDYFYDAVAIEEESAQPDRVRLDKFGGASFKERQQHSEGSAFSGSATRNKRSVWWVATLPYGEAHFATFPPDLIEPCILAGTSERGCCSACGAPWTRQVERETVRDHAPTREMAKTPLNVVRAGWREGGPSSVTTGWAPSCSCGAAVAPCVVLDPFGGAGTTALVSDRLGRDAVLVELNTEYARMAERRLLKDGGLFAQVAAQ